MQTETSLGAFKAVKWLKIQVGGGETRRQQEHLSVSETEEKTEQFV